MEISAIIDRLKENIPEQLKKDALFCLWRYEERDGKKTKVPYNPNHPQQRADSTDPGTFAPFEKVQEVLETVPGFDGIGAGIFGTLCAVDIDHCYQGGQLSDMARWIIDKMGSYTELSPSGEGVRILFYTASGFEYDDLSFYVNNRKIGLEIYVAGSTNRFVTVTGDRIRESRAEERTFELLEVARRYMVRPETQAQERSQEPTGLSDDEITQRAAAARDGFKFMQLWSGDTSGYVSLSEADLALCGILAFWTGRDPEQMDRLFRQSGLMREKWDANRGGQTYGELTVDLARKGCRNVYNPEKLKQESLQPGDWTDVGQAEVFAREYGHKVRFSKATSFLVYDGRKWDEDDIKAQALAQDLTARQLLEVRKMLGEARKKYDALAEAEDRDSDEAQAAIKEAKEAVNKAEAIRKKILSFRASSKIKATLTESRTMTQIRSEDLDADGYLLNTPGGTVDLRTCQIRPHDPEDYCTKITAVAPDQKGLETWEAFLDRLTVGDRDLARYLQEVAGICAIGEVKREELIIATGSGGNGKSTFFNLLARVLGDYSGGLSAEVLTTSCQKNKSPEYAELRGCRIVVAEELDEGMRLDTSIMKKLCSTDPIKAEKKYKDPFSFIPSHHIILCTNHLPKVGTTDSGTWDRLVVVPFNARFRGEDGEVKDYASVLLKECGGAVLSWIIQGAQRVILQGHMIRQPQCVVDAIEAYKKESNWLRDYLDARCVIGSGFSAAAGTLYQDYRFFCGSVIYEKFIRSSKDFSKALTAAGYESKRTKTGIFYRGLRLKNEAELIRDSVAGMGQGVV